MLRPSGPRRSGPVEATVDRLLDATPSRLEQRSATIVERATATVSPWVMPSSTAWSPTTRIAKIATRPAVTTDHDTVRLMSRSMSYRR